MSYLVRVFCTLFVLGVIGAFIIPELSRWTEGETPVMQVPQEIMDPFAGNNMVLPVIILIFGGLWVLTKIFND